MSNILIVDDEPGILEILSCWLSERGHQITCASSGDEAIQLIPKINPDLVITDIRMSPGDGIQVLIATKKYDPSIAVIIMTGHKTTAKDAAETMKLGADDYLCKPFALPDLERRADYALKCREAGKAEKEQLVGLSVSGLV